MRNAFFSSTPHFVRAVDVSNCYSVWYNLRWNKTSLPPTFLFQNPKLRHQVRSTRAQCPLLSEWRNSFSAQGVQTPFYPGLFPTRGIRIVRSSSKLTNLVFVCKSTEQITPLLVSWNKDVLIILRLKMHHWHGWVELFQDNVAFFSQICAIIRVFFH